MLNNAKTLPRKNSRSSKRLSHIKGVVANEG